MEAKANPMFSPLTTACVRFVEYKETVPCLLCGRRSKYHWTCVVRFKASDFRKSMFILKTGRRWFKAGDPVCRDHPMLPDEREFVRKVRTAQRKAPND